MIKITKFRAAFDAWQTCTDEYWKIFRAMMKFANHETQSRLVEKAKQMAFLKEEFHQLTRNL